LFGTPVADAARAQFARVPARATDFIFTAVAEKAGFAGSVAFILLILFILIRCCFIAANARDQYGAMLVAGLTGMLAFHFIENIGMCIGVLPVTGIPLPFVSQGGTAMITNHIAIGVILSVSMRREIGTARG
jgi:rod shape determining protein RodA